MTNDRSKALKSLPVNGSVTAQISHSTGEFKSADIQLHDFPEAVYIDARISAEHRMISFEFAKGTPPGTYDLAENKGKVKVSYYLAQGPMPWTYQPSTGTLSLTEFNVEDQQVTATFSFTSEEVPPGEDPLQVTQGKLKIGEPGRHA